MLTLEQARAKTHWLPDAYFTKLVDVAESVGARPRDLALAIEHESGHHGSALNGLSNAAGLMQWMPLFAPGKRTVAQIRATPELTQLDWVRAWFLDARRKIGGRNFDPPGLVYMAIFAPGRLSPSSDARTVAYRKGESGYRDNAHLDVSGDGVITAGDLEALMAKEEKLDAYQPIAVRLAAAQGGDGSSSTSGGAGLVARGVAIAGGLALTGYTIYRVLRG